MSASREPEARGERQRQASVARSAIVRGELRGERLRELLLSVPVRERDAWVDELLGFAEPPPDSAELPRGAVPYLPSGVDEILAMVRDVPVRADDQLVDLGSGLGRAVILAHLLSGAHASGVEIQGLLVGFAKARSAALNLARVSFVHGDAAEVKLDGSVFFLYAPCNGDLLAAVLRRVEDVARRRPIVVCAVALELHGLAWLERRKTAHVSLALYDSCVVGVPRRERR
ncbi:MAG TPA: class I SAM-dependent methyltransferase [Polyangiaceae bacterium]|jgi:SAM-dependent methyltransferase